MIYNTFDHKYDIQMRCCLFELVLGEDCCFNVCVISIRDNIVRENYIISRSNRIPSNFGVDTLLSATLSFFYVLLSSTASSVFAAKRIICKDL